VRKSRGGSSNLTLPECFFVGASPGGDRALRSTPRRFAPAGYCFRSLAQRISDAFSGFESFQPAEEVAQQDIHGFELVDVAPPPRMGTMCYIVRVCKGLLIDQASRLPLVCPLSVKIENHHRNPKIMVMPYSTSLMIFDSILPTSSTILDLSIADSCDTTSTESFDNPEYSFVIMTFPGAFSNARFVVKGITIIVLILLRLNESS